MALPQVEEELEEALVVLDEKSFANLCETAEPALRGLVRDRFASNSRVAPANALSEEELINVELLHKVRGR